MRGARPLLVALAAITGLAAPACAVPPPAAEVRSLPPVPSLDGRYRLRVDGVLRNLAPDGTLGGSVQVRGSIEPAGGDSLFADGPSVTRILRVVGADGREVPVDGLHLRMDPLHGRWLVSGLPVRPEDDRLPLLELECRILRVRRWTEATSDPVGITETREVHAPPAMLWVRAGPESCWVTAGFRGEWRDRPSAERLAGLLTHAYYAEAARVFERGGGELRNAGGSGSGGTSSCLFVPPGPLRPGRGVASVAVDYPVTVRLRIPGEFTVDTAVFRIAGLPLPPTPGR